MLIPVTSAVMGPPTTGRVAGGINGLPGLTMQPTPYASLKGSTTQRAASPAPTAAAPVAGMLPLSSPQQLMTPLANGHGAPTTAEHDSLLNLDHMTSGMCPVCFRDVQGHNASPCLCRTIGSHFTYYLHSCMMLCTLLLAGESLGFAAADARVCVSVCVQVTCS